MLRVNRVVLGNGFERMVRHEEAERRIRETAMRALQRQERTNPDVYIYPPFVRLEPETPIVPIQTTLRNAARRSRNFVFVGFHVLVAYQVVKMMRTSEINPKEADDQFAKSASAGKM